MALRDWLLIIFIGAIWGCSFLFNAILIRELGPIWVSALRVTVGALGCWAYFVATRRTLPRQPVLYVQFLMLGVFNYAIPFALFPLAEGSLASGLVGVINAMTPMMTVIVSHFWRGGERASLNKSMGVIVGFAGAAILASPSLGSGSSTQLWAIGALPPGHALLRLHAQLCPPPQGRRPDHHRRLLADRAPPWSRPRSRCSSRACRSLPASKPGARCSASA